MFFDPFGLIDLLVFKRNSHLNSYVPKIYPGILQHRYIMQVSGKSFQIIS